MKRTKNKMYHFMIFFISQMVSELGTSMTGFATVIWMYSNSGQVMFMSLLGNIAQCHISLKVFSGEWLLIK